MNAVGPEYASNQKGCHRFLESLWTNGKSSRAFWLRSACCFDHRWKRLLARSPELASKNPEDISAETAFTWKCERYLYDYCWLTEIKAYDGSLGRLIRELQPTEKMKSGIHHIHPTASTVCVSKTERPGGNWLTVAASSWSTRAIVVPWSGHPPQCLHTRAQYIHFHHSPTFLLHLHRP